jgi:hypothetical protein
VLIGSILENDKHIASLPTDLEFVEVPNKCNGSLNSKTTTLSGHKQATGKPSSVLVDSQMEDIQSLTANQQSEGHEMESTRQQLQSMVSWHLDVYNPSLLMQMKQLFPTRNGDVETLPITQKTCDETQEFAEFFGLRRPLQFRSIYMRELGRRSKESVNVTSPSKSDRILCQCRWNEDDGDMVLVASSFQQ